MGLRDGGGHGGREKWARTARSRRRAGSDIACPTPKLSLTPVRFLGLKENKREAELDFQELSARAREGKPLYGETDLSPYIQGMASRNSTFSQFKLQTMPW